MSFQVTKWCNAGVDILASQPLDRFQSAEGAEKALKEIDEFLKKPQGVNLGKLNRMEKTAKEVGDEGLLEQVRMTLARISEVTDMMSNREARFVLNNIKYTITLLIPICGYFMFQSNFCLLIYEQGQGNELLLLHNSSRRLLDPGVGSFSCPHTAIFFIFQILNSSTMSFSISTASCSN